jgi:hypothetical protein
MLDELSRASLPKQLEKVTAQALGEAGVSQNPAFQELAAQHDAPPATDEENAIIEASRELVWELCGEWARNRLGEPGAHLADIRRRLAGL